MIGVWKIPVICKLTHWGRDKMDASFQTTFSNAFSWMKMFEFRLKFHWSLFLGVKLTIFQHWFRLWLGAVQATSQYLNQWWLIYWRIYASLGLNELKCYFQFLSCLITCLLGRHSIQIYVLLDTLMTFVSQTCETTTWGVDPCFEIDRHPVEKYDFCIHYFNESI